ncbi:MAG: anti-sigma factor antagonist [Acholeplasmataceae bacterium]|nr:anti-sigma factor antagonist [Acholeplasmataceae bacterium]
MLNTEIFIKRNILYIRFDGELDQKNVENLRYKMIELIDKYNIKHLVFNFKKLTFMDSSGIGFIIGRYNTIKKINGTIVLCNLNEQIKRLVMLSGLARICEMKKDEEDANYYLGVA